MTPVSALTRMLTDTSPLAREGTKMRLLSMASMLFATTHHDVPGSRPDRAARRARWVALGVAVTIGGVGAVASAQPPVAPAAVAAGVADGPVGFERRVQLTPQQQEAESEIILAQMQAGSGTIQRMLAQARLSRDVVKTLCLNDKLSQVDVANRSATDRKASLHSAVTRNDRELSNHEFTILTVLKKRSEQLSAEANQCIGEEAAFIGATNVVTTVDTTLPTGDPTDVSTGTAAGVTSPPVTASSDQ